MWPIAASWIVLLVSIVLLCMFTFDRWVSKERKTSFSQLVRSSECEDKWSRVFLAALSLGVDSALGAGRGSPSFRHMAATLGLILCLGLAMTGVQSGSFLGFSDTPWNAYDRDVARIAKILEKEKNTEVESRVDRIVATASAPYWKYAYTITASILALAAYVGCFQFVARATRYSIREMNTARSWLQKAGIMYVFALATTLAAITFAFVVGLLTSILPWGAIWIAHILGKSLGFMAGLGVISALFEFYFGGPWFKAFVLAGLVPAIAFLLLVLPTLTADLVTSSYQSMRGVTVRAAYDRFGHATVPLLLTSILLFVVAWSMSKVL